MSVNGLTEDKITVLTLLSDTHHNFWTASLRIRQSHRDFAVAYDITASYTDGLWKDVLFPHTRVFVEQHWTEVNDFKRQKRFQLSFPWNYVGAITEYIVTDVRFVDNGASFTTRTIQPSKKHR